MRRRYLPFLVPASFAFALAACSDSGDDPNGPSPAADMGVETPDGGQADATTTEEDAGFEDTGPGDAGFEDSGVIDPNVEPFRTVKNEGPPEEKIDIVVVGDGYRIEELDSVYDEHVDRVEDIFSPRRGDVTQPFRQYRQAFNVHRIHVASNESGVDDPDGAVDLDTALDGSLVCADPIDGPCHVDFAKVDAAFESALAGSDITPDWRVLVLNTSEEVGAVVQTPNGPLAIFGGGLGGSNATFRARELLMQQLAIAFAGAGTERTTSPSGYTGPEPDAVNLTKSSTTSKWSQWVGYNVGMDGISEVGYYEGGGGFSSGLFRPTEQSKLNNPSPTDRTLRYNAVVREAIILAIYRTAPIATVLDTNPTDQVLDNPLVIDINLLSFELRNSDGEPGASDPLVIEWRVNGIPTSVNDARFGFQGNAEILGLEGGMHTVEVVVRDETPWVRALGRPNMVMSFRWDAIYRP